MIPTKKQCLKILEQYKIPQKIVDHSELVTEVCVFIAENIIRKGQTVNLEMLKAAAMLHDLDKIIIGTDYKKHGSITANILTKQGMGEICSPIIKHSLGHISIQDMKPETIEEKILFYADKICTDKLMSLEERGLDWIQRDPGSKDLILSKLPLVANLENEILINAGISFDDIKKAQN